MKTLIFLACVVFVLWIFKDLWKVHFDKIWEKLEPDFNELMKTLKLKSPPPKGVIVRTWRVVKASELMKTNVPSFSVDTSLVRKVVGVSSLIKSDPKLAKALRPYAGSVIELDQND